MDWNWFLFNFEGRINRAKFWLAAFIWYATVFSFMTIFLFVVAGILRASGNDLHFVSTKTMHPAFYLLGFPLLVIIVWLFAATAFKRLHDRGKSGWWLAPFFIAPGLLNKLSDWLDNPILALLVSALSFGLCVWCFIELFCLRGRFVRLVLYRTVLLEGNERAQPVRPRPAGTCQSQRTRRLALGPAQRD